MADQNEDLVKKAMEEAKANAKEAEANQDGASKAEDVVEANQEVEAEGEAEGETSEAKAEKKKLKFEKKKDKSKEKIDELEDKVKRQLAEFENFRNRSEKEKAAMFDMGSKHVLEKILPVVDNFERGLQTVPEEEAGKPFAEGMNMIYKQLMTELSNLGVKPIEAVGAEFNPEYHNAVMQVESDELESGFVAQELQKGYMYRDTVIRHSMVAVVP